MPEQGPSRFEAFKQGAIEAFEGVMNFAEGKQAVGLIGAVGLAGGGVAVANQLNTESASAAPVPEAKASDLEQKCTSAAFSSTHFKSGYVSAPMRFGLRVFGYKVDIDPMPSDCLDKLSRSVQLLVQVQDATNRNVWHTATDRGSVNDQGEVNVNINNSPLRTNSSETPLQCTPGRRNTGVRLVGTSKVFKEKSISATGARTPVAQKVVIKRPLKVRKPC